jgi:hypothetical protein
MVSGRVSAAERSNQMDHTQGHGSTETGFWDDNVGPFYDHAGLQQLTTLSVRSIDAAVVAGDLLGVVTSDNLMLFPVFQFGERGELLPGLSDVAAALVPISDDTWDIALWLLTPSDDFGGLTAAECLREGHAELVLRMAQRDGQVLRD